MSPHTLTDPHGTVWTLAPHRPGEPYTVQDCRLGRNGLNYRAPEHGAWQLSPCPYCDGPVLPHPGAGRPREHCSRECTAAARRRSQRHAEEAREDAFLRLPSILAELDDLRRRALPTEQAHLLDEALDLIGVNATDLPAEDARLAFALRELIETVRYLTAPRENP